MNQIDAFGINPELQDTARQVRAIATSRWLVVHEILKRMHEPPRLRSGRPDQYTLTRQLWDLMHAGMVDMIKSHHASGGWEPIYRWTGEHGTQQIWEAV